MAFQPPYPQPTYQPPAPTPPMMAPGAPVPSTPAVSHRFADVNANPAYAPKSAPKKGEQEFERTYRASFEEGTHWIRFVGHPTLLPGGFHYHTLHKIPQATGDPIKVLCTESYDPGKPCYICSLIKDLDDAQNNQHDSILNSETLGDRLYKVIVENAQMFCRSIVLPFITRGRVAYVRAKNDPTKEYRQYYPDQTNYTTGTLWITPDAPGSYGNFPDRKFYQMLQFCTLTDSDIQEKFAQMSLHDPQNAQRFLAESQGKFRNPDLFDAQRGSWLAYDKGRKGVAMSLLCQPPTPLDTQLVAKYLTEKVYPKCLEWGKGGDMGVTTRLSWYEVRNTFKRSWMGQELMEIHGWDLDLNPEDWTQHRGVPPQMQAPAPVPQAPQWNFNTPVVQTQGGTWIQQPSGGYMPQNPQSPVQYIDPTHIPF